MPQGTRPNLVFHKFRTTHSTDFFRFLFASNFRKRDSAYFASTAKSLLFLASQRAMSATLSVAAFASSALLMIFITRERSRNDRKKPYDTKKETVGKTYLTKNRVIDLREKHLLKSVSVSYANSGPLMIMRVCSVYFELIGSFCKK